ncbi:hypothetical protein ACFXTI_003760 [Malus domestica]
MERFFKRKSSSGSGSSNNVDSSNTVGSSRTLSSRQSQLDDVLGNLQADPGLRTRIIDYDANMRDEVRRLYLQKGPCQPRGHNFPITNMSGINRRFIPQWFDEFDWLEYSVSKDAAFCLYCYLFKTNLNKWVVKLSLEMDLRIGRKGEKDLRCMLDRLGVFIIRLEKLLQI